MGPYRKLWFTLIAVLAVTFAARFLRRRGHRQAPPIPQAVVAADGQRLFGRDDILDGQTAWQSVGGMQLGSVSHGATRRRTGPRTGCTASERLAGPGRARGPRPALRRAARASQAALRETLKAEYRGNRVNADEVLTVARRARAIAQTAAYDQLFSDAPALHTSREHFAMKENTLPDAGRREQLTRFFWTWAAATERERAPRSPPTTGRTSR